jgi:hypothetical protein
MLEDSDMVTPFRRLSVLYRLFQSWSFEEKSDMRCGQSSRSSSDDDDDMPARGASRCSDSESEYDADGRPLYGLGMVGIIEEDGASERIG